MSSIPVLILDGLYLYYKMDVCIFLTSFCSSGLESIIFLRISEDDSFLNIRQIMSAMIQGRKLFCLITFRLLKYSVIQHNFINLLNRKGRRKRKQLYSFYNPFQKNYHLIRENSKLQHNPKKFM